MFIEPHFVETNGISMAVYEQGDGPAVLFLHGFPELAYSWRHQLPAVAASGYRAIAVDQRGYGRTSAPDEVSAYAMETLIDDVLGLLDALSLPSVTLVGHDWGALVMWHFAMRYPQHVDRLIGLNIPHTPRPPQDPIEIFRARFGDDFYIVNFQDSDEADRAFAARPRRVFENLMRKNGLRRADLEKLPDELRTISLLRVLDNEPIGDRLLTDAELDYYEDAFSRSGFTGPINWYRNWSSNWRAFANDDPRIAIPTLFIAAADEPVVGPEYIEAMKLLMADLTIETLDPCGHWSQQERPDDVNRLITAWLTS